MAKIRVLIVDDEPRAHKILENYIARMPELELAGQAFNAIEAAGLVNHIRVDLILLDITMPEVDGFSFLKQLDKPPFVIFTTAHSDFALESYEYNAVDYLIKPFSFDRFARAIGKLILWKEKDMNFAPVVTSIGFKINGYLQKVLLNDILYIQSMGNYVKIYLTNKILVTQITTTELECKLPSSQFIRIHKSFIINKSKIDSATDEELLIGKNKLPVGKTYKKYVRKFIIEKAN